MGKNKLSVEDSNTVGRYDIARGAELKLLDNSDGFWTKLFDRLVKLPSPKVYEDKVFEWKLNGKK